MSEATSAVSRISLRSCRLPRALGQHRKEGKHTCKIPCSVRTRARKHGTDVEVLGDRECGENLASFRHLANAQVAHAMALPARDVDIAERDAAARGSKHARDGANERSLARAVRTNNGNDGPRVDFDRHTSKRLRVTIEEVEVLDPQHQSASEPR